MKTPLTYKNGSRIYDATGNVVFHMEFSHPKQAREDAERIVDCVNACEGITKQGLRSGIVKNSIKASFLRCGVTEELKETIQKEMGDEKGGNNEI